MSNFASRILILFAGSVAVVGPVAAQGPRILSVTKIWDQGKHNAFTDLLRWRGKFYCTFREADAHVGGDGKLRILESADGKKWDPVALLAEEGIDLRDPHLSITADDRLMIVAGGSVYKGTKTIMGRQPRVAFSKDARTWTPTQRVLGEGDWLWRVTWHEGKCYGIAYNAFARQTPAAKDAAQSKTPVSSDPAEWKLKLVVSADGVKYDLITHLGVPGHPNESTLRFLSTGELMAMVRREGGSTFGWLGTSKPPYKEWKWTETKYRFGGPNFIELPDSSIWGTSRIYPGGAKTALVRMTPTSFEPVLTFPSGGDTSYAGMVWHKGVLWISYYSSHEKKSAIYLAQVDLPKDAPKSSTKASGSRLELFAEPGLAESLQGAAKLKLHQPTPHDVALVFDQPWEGNTSAYFTVFQDGDLYRLYYRGSHYDEKTKKPTHREVGCYAESKDGIHFIRPRLGLFEFEGSKDNNIVWDGPGSHNFTPFKDTNPAAPADARYKALAGGRGGLVPLKSADGIRWTPMSEKPVITKGAFDSQNLAFWDPQIGQYREYHRAFRGVRDIMTGTSPDFLKWTQPEFLTYTGASGEHLYTNAVLPYERAPHLLLGFPTRFLPKTQQVEPTFMVSSDGQRFHRWPDPIIPFTAPRDRDGNRSNYLAWGLVKLPGKDREYSVYGTEAYYKGPAGRLRRFSYRVDGFVSVHAPAEGGEVTTRSFVCPGDRLVANYVTGKAGSLRVAVCDEKGNECPGLGLKDCVPAQGDHIDGAITWKGSSTLRDWAGKRVRLRFELRDADIYSFRIQ